ncbi:DUF547 domain-containing protein [Candidatus Latescibacterota bacterium]
MKYFEKVLLLIVLLIVLLASPCVSQELLPKNVVLFGEKYAAILTQYVNDSGMVDYGNLKRDKSGIGDAASALSGIAKNEYNLLSENNKIAFLINTYNFLTIKVIIDNYPIKSSFTKSLIFPKNSIRQISGVWDDILFSVLGEMMSLNHIEHEILRVEFNEPGIHLALVCAAMGCPPLRNKPYDGEKLDAQIADQARKFVSDRNKFTIDKQKKTVHLSSIFKWYGGDFTKQYGTETRFKSHDKDVRAVLNYLVPYVLPDDKTFLLNESYKISYLDYDWTLNTQVQQPGR